MSEAQNPQDKTPEEEVLLDDISRIKVLSPSMLVFNRFIRNKLAIVGLFILIAMFLFSFLGGIISPYQQQQVFRKYEVIPKEYASATVNKDLRYTIQEGEVFPGSAVAQFVLAKNSNNKLFSSAGTDYSWEEIAQDFYVISKNYPAADVMVLAGKGRFTAAEGFELSESLQLAAEDAITNNQSEFEFEDVKYYIARKGKLNTISYSKNIVVASKLIFDAFEPDARALLSSVDFVYQAQSAIINEQPEFEVAGDKFRIEQADESAIIFKGNTDDEEPFASVSNLTIRAASPDVFLTVDFKEKFSEAVTNLQTSFTVPDDSGEEISYQIQRVHETYTIFAQRESQLIDMYASPSREHWLGTDGNGMDVLTRLMYGGRISLMVGFVVVLFELIIGIVVGGIAGFFGGNVDTILMRFVDLFNSIPFYPIVIILGSLMDTFEIDPVARIFYLMAVLGILGWTGIARVVRGQILSLREQDFMIATEATGIPVARRIFRHLVPNVMPLLIVQATLSLGSIIITEATLSFLGLGVKYPIASWGSIINAATNLHVMTNYWFIWIPAGLLILLTVLGFNFVGDGLRDAFDPKMKR